MPDCDRARPCRAEFSCTAPDASSVFLVGTFSKADMRPMPLARGDDGEWRVVLQLPPRPVRYKVVVYRRQMNVLDDGPYGTICHVDTASEPIAEPAT